MSAVICTLFEGNYHYGAAALINSLYANGFRGDFFIGYRGSLPFWAVDTVPNDAVGWEGCFSFSPVADLNIHFLPVTTKEHFTNYKPEFILTLWDKCLVGNTTVNGIFYFDPDIVNKCKWAFYERWIGFGVAVVHEVVWNDMPPNHPKRFQWKTIADKAGFTIHNQVHSYLNAGFVGVSRENIGVIEIWRKLMLTAIDHFKYDMFIMSQSLDDSDLMGAGDQDLLNIAIMCSPYSISEFGPEGMDFIEGGWLMSHATGSPKPWNVNHLKEFSKGKPVTKQAKEYWKNANGIIHCYPPSLIKRKLLAQKATAALGRLYGK